MPTVNLFYTSNLRGNLELLPQLYTFLKQLKYLPVEDESEVLLCPVQPPIPARTVLLDLGNACDPLIWHCAVTEGRSMLIALDAMGYDAANVRRMLTSESQARLKDNLMSMALVDDDRYVATLTPTPSPSGRGELNAQNGHLATMPTIAVVLAPKTETRLETNQLFLADVQAGQIGMAQVTPNDDRFVLQTHTIFDLPSDTPSDPTIAGTVEFILSEARLYQHKHL